MAEEDDVAAALLGNKGIRCERPGCEKMIVLGHDLDEIVRGDVLAAPTGWGVWEHDDDGEIDLVATCCSRECAIVVIGDGLKMMPKRSRWIEEPET